MRPLPGADPFDPFERPGERGGAVGHAPLRSLIRVSGVDDADALAALLGDELLGKMQRLDPARTARIATDTVARRAEFETALEDVARALTVQMHALPGTVIDKRARFVESSEGGSGSSRTPDSVSDHPARSPDRYGWGKERTA